jgi:DnaJ-class molecular chaperone
MLRILVLVFSVFAVGANHYNTLGIDRTATASEIKLAYRKAALKFHPDRMPRGASSERRRKAQVVFENCNAAFETLGDPAKRRQYDFDLANPIQRGEEPGATPPRPQVEIRVECTLEAFGGCEDVQISLSAWSQALGATVTEEIAQRLRLPRLLKVPPGSRQGDTVPSILPGSRGIGLTFRLVAKPHPRLTRRGDTLHATVVLPAWRNAFGRLAVRVRGLDGAWLTVRARGERTRPTGETVRLTGQGMPVLCSDGRDGRDGRDGEARGDLIVEMKMRSAAEEAAYLASRIGGAAVTTMLAKAALLRLPAMAGGVVEFVFTSAAVVLDCLSTDVLGRARPEARADRMRRDAEQRLLRLRRRDERERRRAQEERAAQARRQAERWRELCASLTRQARAAWSWAWG